MPPVFKKFETMAKQDVVFARYKSLVKQAQAEIDTKDPAAQFLKDVAYRKWTEVTRSLERSLVDSVLVLGELNVLDKRLDGVSKTSNAKFHKVSRRAIEKSLEGSAEVLEKAMDIAGW